MLTIAPMQDKGLKRHVTIARTHKLLNRIACWAPLRGSAQFCYICWVPGRARFYVNSISLDCEIELLMKSVSFVLYILCLSGGL